MDDKSVTATRSTMDANDNDPTSLIKEEDGTWTMVIPFVNKCPPSVPSYVEGAYLKGIDVKRVRIAEVGPDEDLTNWLDETVKLVIAKLGTARFPTVKLGLLEEWELDLTKFGPIDGLHLGNFLERALENHRYFDTLILKNATLAMDTARSRGRVVHVLSGSKLRVHLIFDGVKVWRPEQSQVVAECMGEVAQYKSSVTFKNSCYASPELFARSFALEDLRMEGCPANMLGDYLKNFLGDENRGVPNNRSLRSLTIDHIPNTFADEFAAFLKTGILNTHPNMEAISVNFRGIPVSEPKIEARFVKDIQGFAEQVVDPKHGNNQVIKSMSFGLIPTTERTKYWLWSNQNRRWFNRVEDLCQRTCNNDKAWMDYLIRNNDHPSVIFSIFKANPDVFFPTPEKNQKPVSSEKRKLSKKSKKPTNEPASKKFKSG